MTAAFFTVFVLGCFVFVISGCGGVALIVFGHRFLSHPHYFPTQLGLRVGFGIGLAWMASAAICLAALAQAEGLDLRREPPPRVVPEGLLWLETPEPPDFEAKIRSVRWVRDGVDRFECEYAGAETNGTSTATLQWNRREEWGQVSESTGRIGKFKLEAIPGFTNFYLGELKWNDRSDWSAIAIVPPHDW